MSYETDMQIDETALDVECLDQPALMLKYTKKSAQAKYDLGIKKEALDIKRAELDRAIREDPEKYDIVKPTETAIQNTILLQEDYREIYKDFLKAQYEFDMAQGAVRSTEHKKDAIEYLIRLHGLQYWAGPKVPRDLTQAREQKRKEMNKKIGAKMQRTRE